MTEHIATEIADRILAIRLNRPEKKNAITVAMYSALVEAFAEAEKNPDIRVITITGSADSFSSGNDVMDFLQNAPTDAESPVMQFLTAISTATKPLVAGVNGLAVGVGVTMLLHCDLVYATEEASFQLPFVNLGLVPEAASTLLLPSLIGHQRAAELLLLGEKFDAHTARELGFVNGIVPSAALAATVRERAAVLAAKPPGTLRITKSLLRGDAAAIAARIREEGEHFSRQLKSPEAREAMEAFLQRRKPDFSRFS